MIFPNLVYKCPGPHARKGGTFGYTEVRDESELAEKLANSWFKTLPEAIEGKHAEIVEPKSEVVEQKAEDEAPKRRGRPPKSATPDLLDVIPDQTGEAVEAPNELD